MLDDLIDNLCNLQIDRQNFDAITNSIQHFNTLNSNTFAFGALKPDDSVHKKFCRSVQQWLDLVCAELTRDAASKAALALATSLLDMIRLLSRDTSTIVLFEADTLLELIQKMCGLSVNEEPWCVQLHPVSLSALMSMSNLIYNSKFVQNFYSQNNVAEAITIFLKQFQLSEILRQDQSSAAYKTLFQITIFKLRILFLLTVFNRDLRSKLREKLQVTTYLIEIIDLVMKERVQSSDTEQGSADSADYCYLKPVDIDLVNEILKILYNLTMDIAKPNLNFAGQSQPQQAQQHGHTSEEEEAHLMHLVSVLRDLITCRPDAATSPNFNKISNLHSNIINLLTNMPSICFEELMTPCCPAQSASAGPIATSSTNARPAHGRKRHSRRSKLTRQRQDEAKAATKDSADYESFLLLSSDEGLEFEGKNMEAVTMILSYMERHVTSYINGLTDSDRLYPVLLLLSLMSKSNNIIRHYSRLKVLPPLNKKDLVALPQTGGHIRNRLVRLMTDANLQIKRLVAQLLFILCKESVSRLIKYTGYGNAAGLLAEAGLMLSSHGDRAAYSSDSDSSDTEDYKQLEACINPITGRAELDDAKLDLKSQKYVRTNKRDIFEGLSEEQKEHEAVQLANTIDKLTRLGGVIRPATIGADGRVVQLQHVLELQESQVDTALNLAKKTHSDE
ncbi:synembryn-B isoform X1 [Brachionus plicatilis]|uniref:Synembryn-B isoform X1 n=1 Tax=Brachionus plicatilis TaxID=10195 RepID=A0A3M7SGR7_BRAPC|nr:synembryn-B isoform X1 [Brachionus plicatilis]